jgi:hypothetical protein
MRSDAGPGAVAPPILTAASDLIDIGSADYRHALASTHHDVYHLPGYVTLDAREAGGTPAAYRYREGRSVLLVPLVLRPVPGADGVIDAVSPYGYPGPVAGTEPHDPGPAALGAALPESAAPPDDGFWRRAVAQLPGVLASEGVVSCFVRLHPLLPAPLDALSSAGQVVEHGHTVAIDLIPDEHALWSQVRQNHRRQITKAQRQGLTTSIDDWHRLDTFVEIYHETMTRVAAASYYFFDRDYFAELRSAVGDALHLVTVEDAGEVLGGGLFFTHGGIAQYHLGATRDRHLKRQPAKLMMDEMRRWVKDRGLSTLHLGGGVGGGTDDSLFHFKAGFGPGRAAFHTWRVVPDRAVYRRLSGLHAGDHTGDHANQDDDGGFFPAYRRGLA